MQIVVVDSTITTPPTGGAHTFVVELTCALVRRGEQVSLVTQPGPERSLVSAMREAGVEVREDIWRAVDLPEERAGRLASWVNGRGADVYLVSVSPDAGWLALPLLDARTATVAVVHSDGPAFYEPLRHYQSFIDCAVGVSRETLRKIVSYCGVEAGRARQIPYGVASITREESEARADATARGRAPLRAGYVGRLVQSQKRVLDLVPLAAEMRRRGLDFELHLVGDGPERAPLEEGFRAAGVGGRVKFWGWLSSAEVKGRLRELDVLLLVSDVEGLPVAMLEAMGHGVVPVVTRLDSGNAELVREGVNGFLEGVGDFAAFAERLLALERDRGRLAEMGRAAWETGRDYSVERMTERYAAAFAESAGAAPARRGSGPGKFPVMRSCVSRYPFWLRKLKRRVLVSAGRAGYEAVKT
jgi:glycosyltransferase involved in cell wall biosynthesis